MAGVAMPQRAVAVTKSDTAYITDRKRNAVVEAPVLTTSVVVATNIITQPAHGFSDGDTVTPTALGSVTGITIGVVYFIRDATTDTYKLAATINAAAVDLTGADTTPPTIQRLTSYPAAVRVSGSLYFGGAGIAYVLPEGHPDTDDPTEAAGGVVAFTVVAGQTLPGSYKKVMNGTTATLIVCQYSL